MPDSPSGINTRVHNSGKIRNIAGQTPIATEHSVEISDPRALARFRATGSLVTARTDHAAVALDDGRVFVVGGYDRRTSAATPPLARECELYDSLTNRWRNVSAYSSVATRIAGRVLHTATKLRDGTVLIVGGYAQDPGMATAGPSATAYRFNPATNKFTVFTSKLSAGRQEHSATLLDDGRVLIVGGRSWYSAPGVGYYIVPPAEIFDPETLTFSVAEKISSAWFATQLWSRRSAVGVGNGVLLTSTDQASTLAGPVFMTANGAEYMGALNTARSRAQAGYVSQRNVAFVVGGFTAGGTLVTSLEALNRTTKTWTRVVGALTPARHRFGVAVLGNDAFLIGGTKANGAATSWVEMFDARYADPAVLNYFPASERAGRAWPVGFYLTQPRAGFTATAMKDGRILVAGGLVTSGSCEVFTRP
jgi:hypothetical protein